MFLRGRAPGGDPQRSDLNVKVKVKLKVKVKVTVKGGGGGKGELEMEHFLEVAPILEHLIM